MPTLTMRISDELAELIDACQGASRTEKATSLIEAGLKNPPGLDTVMLSVSEIASLDQTAQRLGLTRVQAMQRFLRERINREFVEERQRQAFGRDRKLKTV